MARSTDAKRCQRFREKVTAHGYRQINGWLPAEILDDARALARRLNVSLQSVLSASLLAGLNGITASEIDRANRRWHEVVGYPIGPLWPDAPCDPSKRASKEFLAEGRRIRKEKLRGKRAA